MESQCCHHRHDYYHVSLVYVVRSGRLHGNDDVETLSACVGLMMHAKQVLGTVCTCMASWNTYELVDNLQLNST